MKEQVRISIDRDLYDRLLMLMVPPIDDANAVIRELLYQGGHDSNAAVALGASEKHFTFEQEVERNAQGIYDCGGAT